MKKLNLGTGALVGALLTAPLIAVMYLADQVAGLPFVPFDLFDWLTRVLPGPVITFGIDMMIDTMIFLGVSVADTAKIAEQVMAVLQFFVGGITAGIVFFSVVSMRKIKADTIAGLVMGALFGLPLIAISVAIGQSALSPILKIVWLALLFGAWGIALSQTYRRLAPAEAEPVAEAETAEAAAVERINRRQFLIRLGATTAAITVVGAGVGTILAQAERRRLEQVLAETEAHQTEVSEEMPFPNSNDPVMAVPGTRPEYTPIKDHYKVFIRTEPTLIDGPSWLLPLTGLVDNPLMLTLDDIKNNFESRDQYVTLSCISGRVGTGLIGTTLWTGVSLQDVLAEVGVRPEARYLHITCGDGFYETVDLELIAADERIMLCYAWDGHDLPADHGYPLRIWIPDRYGMKQPRWITGMEVMEEYTEGYWVERNWDEVAQVKTTSVIDTVAINAIIGEGDQKRVPVGGIAFAGARGISKVEVRVDGGPWQEAILRSPLSETTWVVWRYEWPFEAGEHTFEVRCAEGDGTPQIEEKQANRPSGATGIHSVEETI
ncbi:MAG TPA: molybdopterin-dependent oxidoreductase [Anaerolineae bacterium]|jgi:DMSO/TMAO reductase YedYZ molybdopterin-dependent catalytic subunit